MRWPRLSSGPGVGVILLTMLLAGCGGTAGGPSPMPSPAPAPAPAAEPQPVPKPVPPPPPPPPPDPDRLLGWTPAAVTALFGKPDLVRWEGPVQLYLYPDPAAGCALTMIFREGRDGFHLESLTAHDPTAPDHGSIPSRSCLARMLPQGLWARLAPEPDEKRLVPETSAGTPAGTGTEDGRSGRKEEEHRPAAGGQSRNGNGDAGEETSARPQ